MNTCLERILALYREKFSKPRPTSSMRRLGESFTHTATRSSLRAQIANSMVKRIMVDNGSSTDILFKKRIIQASLLGLTGECVYKEGSIMLSVTIGMEDEACTIKMVDFLIIDRPSSHNAMICTSTNIAYKRSPELCLSIKSSPVFS